MNRVKSVMCVICLVLGAALVPAAQSDCRKLDMDKEFTLKVGEAGIVEGQNRRIVFREVAGDSRCPRGAECIWAGNATVRLSVEDGENEPVVVELNTGIEPMKQRVGELDIALISLDPYPVSGSEIAGDSYRATLKISRAE